MARLDRRRLERLIDKFTQVRLLVLGDLVMDEYLWGDVDRVSPEAPVPVVHVRESTYALGGAGNVARNAVALGAGAALCSVVGEDASGRRVIDALKHLGIDPRGVIAVEGRPTTRKTRIIARSQQMVRFDRETLDPLPSGAGRRLLAALDHVLPTIDVAVVEDYGKGVLSKRVVAGAMRRFANAGLPVSVDPKTSVTPFRGATLLKPNLNEAEHLSGIAIREPGDLERAAARLRRRIGGGAVVVTRGGEGMSLFEEDGTRRDVRTVAREVFDVQGAGDTAIAALSLALRVGASLLEAAIIANAAAGVVVGKVGTATASLDEVRELLPTAINAAEARS